MIQWRTAMHSWLSELNRAHVGIIWGHPPAQNQDFCISWTRDSTWLKQWRYSGIQESRQMAQNQGPHATQNLIYVLQLGRWGLHPPRVTKLLDHSNGSFFIIITCLRMDISPAKFLPSKTLSGMIPIIPTIEPSILSGWFADPLHKWLKCLMSLGSIA